MLFRKNLEFRGMREVNNLCHCWVVFTMWLVMAGPFNCRQQMELYMVTDTEKKISIDDENNKLPCHQ
jgi:hypothetical protein